MCACSRLSDRTLEAHTAGRDQHPPVPACLTGHDGNADGMSCQCEYAGVRTHVCCGVLFAVPALCRTASPKCVARLVARPALSRWWASQPSLSP